MHERYMPFAHRFRYGLSLIDLDIDQLDEADQQSSVFSIDKPGLFSFSRDDHGARRDEALRPWAETEFKAAGIELSGGPIRLITFPRHLLYKFAPLSLWLGFGSSGELRGVLYEVNNTFGETHVYAAATPQESRHQHSADKVFHVSPFFDITGKYEFTLRYNTDRLSLIIKSEGDKGRTHIATIQAKACPASTPAFLKLMFVKPFSSLAVSLAIHWQALKLWIKGAKYHSKPKQSQPNRSIAISEEDKLPLRETAA